MGGEQIEGRGDLREVRIILIKKTLEKFFFFVAFLLILIFPNVYKAKATSTFMLRQ